MKNGHIGELGRLLILSCKCPFCEADCDDCETGFGYDDREGGNLTCHYCGVSIEWMDDPFEYEIEEYKKDDLDLD